jgi:hypothetical protein
MMAAPKRPLRIHRKIRTQSANFTIDSISKIAAALERDVVLRLKTYTEVVEIKEFVHPRE